MEREERRIFFDKILNESKFISNLPKFGTMFKKQLEKKLNKVDCFKKGYQIGYGQGIANFMRKNGLSIQTEDNGKFNIYKNNKE